MSTCSWHIARFEELSNTDLYALLRLRTDVFVVEQDCPYPELDGKDADAIHLLGKNEQGELIGYARILPPEHGKPPAIGRVVVKKASRGSGMGHTIMKQCLAFLQQEYGSERSRLSAQAHLANYYESHGYRAIGEVYPLDGIPHIDMEFSAAT